MIELGVGEADFLYQRKAIKIVFGIIILENLIRMI